MAAERVAEANGNAADYFIDRHLRDGNADRLAFRDPWRSLTYAALRDRSAAFAGALRAAGVAREQRIALLLLDTIDFPIAFWGALRAGIVPVPINTLLPAELTGYILGDSRAVALVVSEPLLPAVRPVLRALPELRHVIVAAVDGSPPAVAGERDLDGFLRDAACDYGLAACSPDEVGFWLYSSGSTGAPKGTRHLHASLRATADAYGAQVLQIEPDDVVFSAAKLFFAYGLGNAMTFPMAVGASAVLLPERPTPDAVMSVMRTHQPTVFGGIPTLYASLLAHPEIGRGAGSRRLRRCISAGEALPAPISKRWRETAGVDILDGIGSTEMLHIFLSNRPDEIRYGTTGKPVPGYELRLIDADGRAVGDGEQGELVVRGPSAADGYWNQREKSRRTFRGEWTHTGDTYIRDGDGYYRYCGRSDDMLKVGGIWVSPFEVEEALGADEAVLEAAVVGHADAEGLIKPKAFVVLRPGADDREPAALRERLQATVKESIGVWKYPRWIEFVEALPKTATGKIQRYKLRKA
jgi:4-hydroxybenzoate-CoA ligase